MKHPQRAAVLLIGIALAVAAASCSGDSADSTTTTEDRFSEITYDSPGVGIGVFNGVTCDLDSDFNGTITGEDDAGGTIEMVVDGGTGTMSIDDEWLQIADVPVTSVEYVDEFALDIVADSVPVRVAVIVSEWPECSA